MSSSDTPAAATTGQTCSLTTAPSRQWSPSGAQPRTMPSRGPIGGRSRFRTHTLTTHRRPSIRQHRRRGMGSGWTESGRLKAAIRATDPGSNRGIRCPNSRGFGSRYDGERAEASPIGGEQVKHGTAARPEGEGRPAGPEMARQRETRENPRGSTRGGTPRLRYEMWWKRDPKTPG